MRLAKTAAFVAAGALALTACGGGSSNGGSAQVREMGTSDINAQPASALKDGGTVNLPISTWPTQWNYTQVDGTMASMYDVGLAMFPQPFLRQSDGTVKRNPDVLTKAELVSQDPQVVELSINPEATWSDGTPMTWKDYAAMWKAQNGTNPDYQPSSNAGWEDIDKVEKGATDRDVKLHFARNFGEWKGLTDFLLPASQLDSPEKFNKGWIGKIPLTGGPFKVKSLDQTSKTLVLERDPNWWGAKPKLDTVTFKVVDTSAQAQALANGSLDAAEIGPDVATYQALQQDQNVAIRKALSPDWRLVNFSAKKGSALADADVRIAMMKGIDRKAIAKSAIGPIVPDVRPLENRIFVEGQKGYQNNGKDYGYDPAAAKKELDAAGWKLPQGKQVREKDGKPLQIEFMYPSGTPVSANEGQLIQKQLGEIGAKITFNVVDVNAWSSQYLTPGNFDMQNMSWIGTPFPVTSSQSIYRYNPDNTAQNFGRIPDTEGVGKLFDKANATLDDAERIKLGNEIDKALWKEGFSLPLYQRPDAWGVKKGLANYGAYGFSAADYTKIGWQK